MTPPISVVNVAKYYRDLPHQNQALQQFETRLLELPGGLDLLGKLALEYRDGPAERVTPGSTQPGRALSSNRLAVAEFSMKLRHTQHLIQGTFRLLSETGSQMFTCAATSGAPGFQTLDNLWTRNRGPIPNLPGLRLSTRQYWSDNIGIEGEWFDILPVFVTNPQNRNLTRGHFGLHRDANAPGSQGCIVIGDTQLFKSRVVAHLDRAYSLGIEDVPLRIIYT